EVIEKLKQNNYDVILMDVQMPEMDGLETTRAIRSQFDKQPKIIAMTANAMVEDKEDCFKAGMDYYISKPLQLALVMQTLKSASTGQLISETKDLYISGVNQER
ncbi:MAG TPA: response regulator, partial [Flavobacterium sp.]